MTSDQELGEILRRALHEAVDPVEPAGDGLQRIRHRLEQPRWQLRLRLWLTECADLAGLIGVRLAPALSAACATAVAAWIAVSAAMARAWTAFRTAMLRAWQVVPGTARAPAGRRPAAGGTRVRHGHSHRSLSPSRMAALAGGLRPALAVAAAVAVVVAGVFGLLQLRQGVTSISLLGGGGRSPSHAATPGTASTSSSSSAAPGVQPPVPQLTPTAPAPGIRHHASPSPTCTPRASSTPPGAAATPTATPSPSATATDTPSPAGSGTASPSAPASTPAVAASAAAAGLPSDSTVTLVSPCGSQKASATPSSSPTP